VAVLGRQFGRFAVQLQQAAEAAGERVDRPVADLLEPLHPRQALDRQAGHPLFRLVPVYLFVRASKTKQRPDCFYVWILCFVLSILMTAR